MRTTATSESEPPTTALLREGLANAQELVRVELLLAKAELYEDLVECKRTAICVVAAAVSTILGLAMLLVALASALGLGGTIAVGTGLLTLSMISGAAAYLFLPKSPMARTRGRVLSDEHVIREHLT
jgi:hypothetical protein